MHYFDQALAPDSPAGHPAGPVGVRLLDKAGPARRIVLPFLLAAAGALGGVLDAGAAQVLLDKYSVSLWAACAWVGGGIGLGIGITLALAFRRWVFALPAPILGAAGYVAAVVLASTLDGDTVPTFQQFLKDPLATRLAAVATPVLVVAHLWYARSTWLRASLRRGTVFYAVLGAISGSVLWAGVPRFSWANALRAEIYVGLLCGAIYGLVQFGAVRLLERMTARESPSRNPLEDRP
ncbi:MAG: hypothetical protein L0323_00740 [Planctomycetes bacterium]|nr:hypothetical protein [Planctomycetota bacterium]